MQYKSDVYNNRLFTFSVEPLLSSYRVFIPMWNFGIKEH